MGLLPFDWQCPGVQLCEPQKGVAMSLTTNKIKNCHVISALLKWCAKLISESYNCSVRKSSLWEKQITLWSFTENKKNLTEI